MNDLRSFEAMVLPHLDAAFNVARWLLRDDAGAEDAVQEAVLRAMRHFKSLRGDNARPWFLAIVRNVCFSTFDERSARNEQYGQAEDEMENSQWRAGMTGITPDDILQSGQEKALIDAALRDLPPILREVIVLRELEGMSYEDIARVVAIPLGTVMSRLARARVRLKTWLMYAGAR